VLDEAIPEVSLEFDAAGGVVDVVPDALSVPREPGAVESVLLLAAGGVVVSVAASSLLSHPTSATDTREARRRGVYLCFMTSVPLFQGATAPWISAFRVPGAGSVVPIATWPTDPLHYTRMRGSTTGVRGTT